MATYQQTRILNAEKMKLAAATATRHAILPSLLPTKPTIQEFGEPLVLRGKCIRSVPLAGSFLVGKKTYIGNYKNIETKIALTVARMITHAVNDLSFTGVTYQKGKTNSAKTRSLEDCEAWVLYDGTQTVTDTIYHTLDRLHYRDATPTGIVCNKKLHEALKQEKTHGGLTLHPHGVQTNEWGMRGNIAEHFPKGIAAVIGDFTAFDWAISEIQTTATIDDDSPDVVIDYQVYIGTFFEPNLKQWALIITPELNLIDF